MNTCCVVTLIHDILNHVQSIRCHHCGTVLVEQAEDEEEE